MGAFICKQPNGKYCRFSTVVDTITQYNMTEEDYIEMCAERAREEAREVLNGYLNPFDMIYDYFCPNNNTIEEFCDYLKEMGEDENKIKQFKDKYKGEKR